MTRNSKGIKMMT